MLWDFAQQHHQHTGRPAAACMGRIHTIRCHWQRSICSQRQRTEPARSAASEAGSRQPPAWIEPLHQHTGRPAAAGRARSFRRQQCNLPADAAWDRARSISTPVDLQPLAWIEPTRSAASEAANLQPLAWTKPIRSAAGEAASRQPPAWIEPAPSAHRSTCSRR